MRHCFPVSICLCLLLGCTTYGGDTKPAEQAKTGLAVGNKAPQFTLKDQNGKPRKLSEFLNKGNKVALVFYRSASW